MSRSGWRRFRRGNWGGLGAHLHSQALAETDMLYQFQGEGYMTAGTGVEWRFVYWLSAFWLRGASVDMCMHASVDMCNGSASSVSGQSGINVSLHKLKQRRVSTTSVSGSKQERRDCTGRWLCPEPCRRRRGYFERWCTGDASGDDIRAASLAGVRPQGFAAQRPARSALHTLSIIAPACLPSESGCRSSQQFHFHPSPSHSCSTRRPPIRGAEPG